MLLGIFVKQLFHAAGIIFAGYKITHLRRVKLSHGGRRLGMEKRPNRLATSNIYDETVNVLLAAANEREHGAQGHGERVTAYAVGIAEKFGFEGQELLDIKYAASLHDIGKIAISRRILNKLGSLSDEELSIMRRHSMIAIKILERAEGLRGAIPFIRHHHERFDGTGYPDGLAGEEIPLGARIIAVAETYDILTSDVPWRDALSPKQARSELQRCSGTQFDPRVVFAFLSYLDDLEERESKSNNTNQLKAA